MAAGGLPAGAVERAAERLGCQIAQLKALIEIESGGGWITDIHHGILHSHGVRGFTVTGALPAILFEAHWFSKLTQHRFDETHPQISSRVWNRALYRGGAREYERLDAACALDREAALQSASWGIFQILGANYAICGFATVEDFVQSMCQDEAAQLEAFVAFIRGRQLASSLRQVSARAEDCRAFAAGYNGPRFAEQGYHEKLARAYRRHADPKEPSPHSNVAALQRALNERGAQPVLMVDGIMGPRTRSALEDFQRRRGLAVDGIPGPVTRAALGLDVEAGTGAAPAASKSEENVLLSLLKELLALWKKRDPL